MMLLVRVLQLVRALIEHMRKARERVARVGREPDFHRVSP